MGFDLIGVMASLPWAASNGSDQVTLTASHVERRRVRRGRMWVVENYGSNRGWRKPFLSAKHFPHGDAGANQLR